MESKLKVFILCAVLEPLPTDGIMQQFDWLFHVEKEIDAI
jgi:hypothetical protein